MLLGLERDIVVVCYWSAFCVYPISWSPQQIAVKDTQLCQYHMKHIISLFVCNNGITNIIGY